MAYPSYTDTNLNPLVLNYVPDPETFDLMTTDNQINDNEVYLVLEEEEKEIFYATYNETAYEEVVEAYESGKNIVVIYPYNHDFENRFSLINVHLSSDVSSSYEFTWMSYFYGYFRFVYLYPDDGWQEVSERYLVTVSTNYINNNAITTAKIADKAVTTAKIADKNRLIWYGTCNSAAVVTTKSVTIGGIAELTNGLTILVMFVYSLSVSTNPILLRLNNFLAYPIKATENSHIAYGTTNQEWIAGSILTLVFTGDAWVIVDGAHATTTSYGKTKLNLAIDSTSISEAATPSAVKQAYDLANSKVSKSGDTMTGYLAFNGSNGITFNFNDNSATTIKTNGYDGDSTNNIPRLRFISKKANTSGSSDYNVLLQGIANPKSDYEAANKQYVDNTISSAIGAITVTDEKVKATPLNGTNSDKGLLFSSSTGSNETTNSVYTSNKLSWNDYSQTLYIYNSDASKYGTLTYGSLSLAQSSSSYKGYLRLNPLTTNRNYYLPDVAGTIALTSDIPTKITDLTNDSNFVTLDTALTITGTKTFNTSVALSNTSQIQRPGYSVLWWKGRDGAMLYQNTYTGYNPIISMKTTNGAWSMGPYSNDTLYFSYVTDTDYNSLTNTDNHTVCITSTGQLYGAVWNDYAEFRAGEDVEPGRVVREKGDDTLELANGRLLRGCSIVSDTFGFGIGENNNNKLPVAVSGRVLAYPYESRDEFRKYIGYAVCSGPNGTVSIMTEQEERDYPSAIIGTISAVPDYEVWHGGIDVEIKNRIWIKVR